uniref:Uncharacterized protein n=1 Tax=Globisporangium ultimum (strain ATCC 200006 / CBS 805.95 / DAOM BR144) TaxID=431595 RepID=K3WMU2_GLOUD
MVASVSAAGTAPSLYDYVYDGKTTYCYWVDQGMDIQNLDFAYVRVQGEGNECPMTMTISQSTAGAQPVALQDVEFVFTATLNLDDNVFDLHALTTSVPDPVTGLPVQIGHANVHSCSRTTVCDVFRTGSSRKITTQETSNFTGNSATFHQKLAFDRAGDYNVFAHIILPPANPLNASYHFITFTTSTIASADSATTSSSGDSSSALVIGLIIGGVILVLLLVLGILFCKRRRAPNAGDIDMFRSSGGAFVPTLTTKNHSKMDWNPDPEFQWKDTYGSAAAHSHGASEFHQPPGLSASALAFHERMSSRHPLPKTASSSGTQNGASSPRMYGNDGFDSPVANVQVLQQRSQGIHQSHMMSGDPYSAYGNPDYRTQQEVDNFRIPSAIIKSFESDNSMGTSLGFNTESHYAPYRRPASETYDDRESDLSSIHADDYDGYDLHHAHPGGDAALKTLDEGRLSDISMATVDFTLHRPQPPRAIPSYHPESTQSSQSTVNFGATNRSTEMFEFHDSRFRETGSLKSDSSMLMPPSSSSAQKRTGEPPRDGRTLSDGEMYEF